ncbi:MAG: cupin domain-containing protein [Candidatus Dormibacteraceae bacterium]
METYSFADDGTIPNSRLPVLVHRGIEAARDPAGCEGLFTRHGWLGAWRDGIYPFHHFHSTAHEVLGIAGGSATVLLGGPAGRRFEVRRGDVLVLPAGTGHCRLDSGHGLLVVGAYPEGMSWDVRRGDPAEYEEVRANIGAVPLPRADPVDGPDGPLRRLWRHPC